MPRSLFPFAATNNKNASLDEYTVDVRDLNRWSIPKVPSKQIYDLGSFTLAWSHLLSETDIRPFREKYKFLHIGCVQIAIRPLTLKGLNTSLMLSLRDTRCLNWANSLMGAMETNLINDPVYFNIYPDLALSMTDPHLLKSLSLNLMTHNYHFLPGSETIAIVYRIYYRVLNTLTSNIKVVSKKDKTTLIESNIISTKTAIPRTLKWDEIEFPTTWQMLEATVPQPLDKREVEQIAQDVDEQQWQLNTGVVIKSSGITEPTVVNQIVAGFSGDLYEWWNNYLKKPYQHSILYAVKIDESGPILDSDGKPISDAVMTLLVQWESNNNNNNIPALWRTYEIQRWINYYTTQICETTVNTFQADLEDWNKNLPIDELDEVTSTDPKELRKRYMQKFPTASEAEAATYCATMIQRFFATTFPSHQPALTASSAGNNDSEGSIQLSDTEAEAVHRNDE
ncbi:hypothetical protein H6P81_002973 [Aristolochia fimbriata]|uniref:DUF7746 domain-containing protein n=1 Tax=Aristolochia fimbriata TaxID=158543 RepID=A0AAV7FB89_ARIFI|nr:hypothetical protein H6P81_002973 [Aristolochia fimbriata]